MRTREAPRVCSTRKRNCLVYLNCECNAIYLRRTRISGSLEGLIYFQSDTTIPLISTVIQGYVLEVKQYIQ